MENPKTDEVFPKIRLKPVENEPHALDDESIEAVGFENQEKPASFASQHKENPFFLHC